MRRMFVYGTLMPGQVRWPLLEPFALGATPATARGRLWDTGLGYPAARFDAGDAILPGFVVVLRSEAADTAIAALDEIEGEGVLFRRVEVDTSGGRAISYEWLGPTEGLVPLPDGWLPRG